MYGNGIRVKQDISKSIELYKRAADLNNKDAMYIMGLYYEIGDYVEQDLFKAVDLYYRVDKEKRANNICQNELDIINMYMDEKQINDNLIEESLVQVIDEPENTKEYFYGYLELNKINEELEEKYHPVNKYVDGNIIIYL